VNTPFAQKRTLDREKNPPQGAWRLMILMFIILLVFFLTYFGLEFGYKAYLNAQIIKIDNDIAALSAEIPKDEQAEFLQFQYQLINLRNLLRDHIMSTRVMPLIEANTNQGIYYSDFRLEVESGQIRITGIAQSFDRLAEQLEAYSRMQGVLRYQIGNSSLSEGNRVDFNVTLFLDPQVFKS
jgi:septal ring factor EnvC (AmiA/AmiB activator)